MNRKNKRRNRTGGMRGEMQEVTRTRHTRGLEKTIIKGVGPLHARACTARARVQESRPTPGQLVSNVTVSARAENVPHAMRSRQRPDRTVKPPSSGVPVISFREW